MPVKATDRQVFSASVTVPPSTIHEGGEDPKAERVVWEFKPVIARHSAASE
jgi:hypothetical protein